MKKILNKLPVKTTNNFKINNIELDLDDYEQTTENKYQIDSDIEIIQQIKKQELTTKIGLTFTKYLEVIINIPKNKVLEKPIILNYTFSSNEVQVSHIIIKYEPHSEANIIIRDSSKEKGINHIKETVELKEYSKGSITYINEMNEESINMIALEGTVSEDAKITHNLIDIGGNIRVYNAYLSSLGYSSSNELNNIYIGKSNNIIDMNYVLENIGKKSNNQLKVEGVLKDNSHKNFRGTIDFKKGSEKSIGEENENCLLLSDDCISRSLPMLLCEEEDVVGSHGVSSGKVPKEKLFYLMTRGLSKKEAEKLIALANFSSIIEKIPDKEIKEEILERIDEILEK